MFKVHVSTYLPESDEEVWGYVGYCETGRGLGMRPSGNEKGDFVGDRPEAERVRDEWAAGGWYATLVET